MEDDLGLSGLILAFDGISDPGCLTRYKASYKFWSESIAERHAQTFDFVTIPAEHSLRKHAHAIYRIF